MATKKVNIDIIAKDKTRMAMATATRGVNNLKNSVFNLKVAFAALGVGFIARDFIKTAREIERLKVRFKFLFDTVAEGEKALTKDGDKMFNATHILSFKKKADTNVIADVATKIMGTANANVLDAKKN